MQSLSIQNIRLDFLGYVHHDDDITKSFTFLEII